MFCMEKGRFSKTHGYPNTNNTSIIKGYGKDMILHELGMPQHRGKRNEGEIGIKIQSLPQYGNKGRIEGEGSKEECKGALNHLPCNQCSNNKPQISPQHEPNSKMELEKRKVMEKEEE